MTLVRPEPAASRSRVKHSTTEPLRSPIPLYMEHMNRHSRNPGPPPPPSPQDMQVHRSHAQIQEFSSAGGPGQSD